MNNLQVSGASDLELGLRGFSHDGELFGIGPSGLIQKLSDLGDLLGHFG